MSKTMNPLYKCVILLGLLACCSLRADQATLVVSPNGPVSTLEAARLQVRELKKQRPGQPIKVLKKKGLAAQWQNRLEYFLPLFHARENRISMNDISRTLLKLHDGNAIYFSAMGENSVVERNYHPSVGGLVEMKT